jgi:hypothetical protein
MKKRASDNISVSSVIGRILSGYEEFLAMKRLGRKKVYVRIYFPVSFLQGDGRGYPAIKVEGIYPKTPMQPPLNPEMKHRLKLFSQRIVAHLEKQGITSTS